MMASEMNCKYETGLSDVFGDFSKTLQETIENIINKEGFVKYRIEKTFVPQDGNFLSTLYEIDVTGETADGEKVMSLFIKKSVTLEKTVLVNISDAYSRELFIYTELLQIFSRLQHSANIPHKKRFRISKCYPSNNEAIIMENLSKKGFRAYDGTQDIKIRFAELSLKELAKFHAFSYIIKKRIPKYFNSKMRTIKQSFNLTSDWEGFIHNVCAAALEAVQGEAKAKIANYAPRMIKTFKKFMKNHEASNGCLCHGDYKIQNILVKEVDGEASEVQVIDYQLLYYGNPIDDFLYFIYSSTDREFRKKHLCYLKNLYFENFAKFLSYFNIDVDSTYSRQEFENDYKERLEMGLVYGLYMSAFAFAHLDEGFDMCKRSLSELPIIPDELFTERVRGIVDDYIEWGYL